MKPITRSGSVVSATLAIMLAAALCLFGATATAYAGTILKAGSESTTVTGNALTVSTQADVAGNLKYRIITAPTTGKGTAKVIGVVSKKKTKLLVPSEVTINGAQYQVVEIGKGAFKSWKRLKKARIASTVKTIRADAFRNTKSLIRLEFDRSPANTVFAKKALRGIGKNGGKKLNVVIPWNTSRQVKALFRAGLKDTSKVNGYPLTSLTVRFDANKGSVSKRSKTVTNFRTYGELPTPKRYRYRFEGWYTKKKGGERVTKSTVVELEKDQTLYAHWYGPGGVGKTITRAEYDKLKYGMSYSEVKFIIGGPGKAYYSGTRDEWIDDSHEEWVDTSYEQWVEAEYDEYGNEISGGYWTTVEDGYWETIDDSYTESVFCESYIWNSSNGGTAYLDFEDGKLVDWRRYYF